MGRLIRSIDPRAKMIFLVGFVTIFFLKLSLVLLFGYLLVVILLLMSFGVKSVKVPLVGIWPLLFLIIVLTPLFNRSGKGLLVVSGIPIITLDGLVLALRLAIRFCGITLVVFLFYISTTQTDTILTLRWFGMPFRFALTITVSLRYIPYLTDVYNDIKSAHKLRGVFPGNGKKRGKRTRIFPILVSLMIYAVKRIPTLAMSLECRGVGRKEKRSSYLELKGFRYAFVDFLVTSLFFVVVLSPLFFF